MYINPKKTILAILISLCLPSLALAQIPTPTVPVGGELGPNGVFGWLNGGTIASSDANYTMTYPNTSCFTCNVTGTWTAARTWTLPAVTNDRRTIGNNTTNGYPMNISPSSGLSIPNGTWMTVWFNGTNYVQIDGVPSSTGSVTSVSFTGASPLFSCTVTNPTTTASISCAVLNANANLVYAGPASGSAAAATFRSLVSADIPNNSANTTGNAATSTAFATTPSQCPFGPATGIAANGNANCTTNTGSGNTVLQTSPTLITPNLGTPSAGIATNLTGLPLTTGVVGQLPNANLVNSSTTVNGQPCVLGSSCTVTAVATSVPFSGVTTSTNTTASLTVGSGATLAPSGTGTITATSVPYSGLTGTVPTWNQNTSGNAATATALAGTPSQCPFGPATGIAANGNANCTTNTGSGNTVLQTSPTLITPNLGTPSAVLLTNATGLPYSGLTGPIPFVQTSPSAAQTVTQPINTNFTVAGSGTGVADFSGFPQFKLPIAAGYTTSASGELGHDSTNHNWHIYANSLDNYVALFPSGTPPNSGDCAKFVLTGSTWTLGDYGAVCGASVASSVNINTANSQVVADSITHTAGYGILAFGASNMAGQGQTAPQYNNVYIVAQDYGVPSTAWTNDGVSGSTNADVAAAVLNDVSPTIDSNPLVYSDTGAGNDVQNLSQPMTTAQQIAVAKMTAAEAVWATANPTWQVQGNSSLLTIGGSGTCTTDSTSFPATIVGKSCTAGSTITLPTAIVGTNQAFCFLYGVNGSLGTSHVSVDGTTVTDIITGLSSLSGSWTNAPPHFTPTMAGGAACYTGISNSTTHSIVWTVDSGTAEFLLFDLPTNTRARGSAAPMFALTGVLPDLTGNNQANRNIVTALDITIQQQLVAMGLDVEFIPVNDADQLLFFGSTAVQNCVASNQPGEHLNNCGQAWLAKRVESVLNATGNPAMPYLATTLNASGLATFGSSITFGNSFTSQFRTYDNGSLAQGFLIGPYDATVFFSTNTTPLVAEANCNYTPIGTAPTGCTTAMTVTATGTSVPSFSTPGTLSVGGLSTFVSSITFGNSFTSQFRTYDNGSLAQGFLTGPYDATVFFSTNTTPLVAEANCNYTPIGTAPTGCTTAMTVTAATTIIPGLTISGTHNLTGVQGTTGTNIAATSGTFTPGNFRSTNSTGDEIDSGISVASVTILSATTGSLGGSPLAAGSCTSLETTVTGAAVGMVVAVSPSGSIYPGDGILWRGYVDTANGVITYVCATIAATPTSMTYNIRVIP